MQEVVYFVAASGKIKIGFTSDLESRVSNFRGGSPHEVELLGAIPGGKHMEGAIHLELRAFRSHGEWFEDSAFARSVINRMLDQKGVRGELAYGLTSKRSARPIPLEFDESAFVARAAALAEKIINREKARGITTAAAMIAAAEIIGLPYGFLWALRYRPPKAITAAQWALMNKAVAESLGLGMVRLDLAGQQAQSEGGA